MDTVEFVKEILRERRIPLSRIEKDLGFSNGYIGRLRKGFFPPDRLTLIADYLSLSPEYLASCGHPSETSGSHPVLSDSESDMLLLYRDLDPVDQNQVIGFIKGLLSGEKYKKASPSAGVVESA